MAVHLCVSSYFGRLANGIVSSCFSNCVKDILHSNYVEKYVSPSVTAKLSLCNCKMKCPHVLHHRWIPIFFHSRLLTNHTSSLLSCITVQLIKHCMVPLVFSYRLLVLQLELLVQHFLFVFDGKSYSLLIGRFMIW